jgi:hypothetical protein
LISSPVPLPPSRRRRRASLGSSPGSPSSGSGGSDRGGRSDAGGFSKLACKVAVLITGVVADCAAMGFRDCTESGTFVRRNVAEWEEAAVEMSMSLSDWREGGEKNTEMERALSRNMRRLANWRKSIAKRTKKKKKAVSFSSSSFSSSSSSSSMNESSSSRLSLDKENGVSPVPARGHVGEKSRHLRKDGSAYLARKILKKKRPNTPASGGGGGSPRSPLSANATNGASSSPSSSSSSSGRPPVSSLRKRKPTQEENEADLSKLLDDSVISSDGGAFTPSKPKRASGVYDYRSASKAAYDKLLRLVDSDDEDEDNELFADR